MLATIKKATCTLYKKLFRSEDAIVAVVSLKGVIGQAGSFKKGLTLESVNPQLEKAFEIKGVKLVVLEINSPGGSPAQSELIGQRIRDLSNKHNVDVWAFCEDVAASGGYWLACAADRIYALDSSIVGSIGVITAGFGFPELIKRYGIERRVYTAGVSKSTLDPFKEEKPEDIERLQTMLGTVHGSFKEWVKHRRGAALKAEDDTLFNGEFWAGKDALSLGLIDDIGGMHRTIIEKFGEDVSIQRMEEKTPFFKKLLGGSAASLGDGFVESLAHRIETMEQFKRFGR